MTVNVYGYCDNKCKHEVMPMSRIKTGSIDIDPTNIPSSGVTITIDSDAPTKNVVLLGAAMIRDKATAVYPLTAGQSYWINGNYKITSILMTPYDSYYQVKINWTKDGSSSGANDTKVTFTATLLELN